MQRRETNDDLIAALKRNGALSDPLIENAFCRVDRKDFMAPRFTKRAYEDSSFPLTKSETISQPSTVAFMLHLLDLRKGDRVLDLGTGSGYTTALLGQIVGDLGSVVGVERKDDLVAFGRANLAPYMLAHVHIERSGSALGAPNLSPFDRILVSAAAKKLPSSLLNQLHPNGVLVVPIGSSIWQVRKREKAFVEIKEFLGFRFIPLIQCD